MLPTPEFVDAAVVYEPVYSQLMSLMALGDQEKLSGLSEWTIQTANVMPPELRAQHQLLFRWIWLDALVNAIPSDVKPVDFLEYVNILASQPALGLRDRLFDQMVSSTHIAVGSEYWQIPVTNRGELLQSYEAFENHFREIARTKYDSADVRPIHTLLNNPDQLQTLLVSHLRTLWERYLAPEWEQAAPCIQECVNAFQAAPLNNLTILEAIHVVTGRDLRPAFRLEKLLTFRQVCFVPHVHNGPYILWFGKGETLYIGFPARKPTATESGFDHFTFVNRCKALADSTRLAILLALAHTDALSTSDIIERFTLDKSAASRHLRQLVANSLINEQRIDRAKKAYQLNRPVFVELIDNLRHFS